MSSLIKTIGVPTGNIIFNIIGNTVAIMCPSNDMVVIATLPTEINIIAVRIHRDSSLKSTNHNRKRGSQCRDARAVRPVVVNSNYRVNMVRHNDGQRDLYIWVMNG